MGREPGRSLRNFFFFFLFQQLRGEEIFDARSSTHARNYYSVKSKIRTDRKQGRELAVNGILDDGRIGDGKTCAGRSGGAQRREKKRRGRGGFWLLARLVCVPS